MGIFGLTIGLLSFLIIGVFHPIVVKCEYYLSWRVWPAFLAFGGVFLLLSLLARTAVLSAGLGVLGFTCLWSIGELREQYHRVEKGWFPRGPGHSR